jgi:4-carboxymuconolactone decarboxylase
MHRLLIAAAFLVSTMALSGQSRQDSQSPPRLPVPRIPPLPEAQWSADIRTVLQQYQPDGRATNDFRTLARHQELLKGVMPFAAYVSKQSTLNSRDRELLILRTAWLCRSEYVWASHVSIAQRDQQDQQGGLTAGEVRRVAEGPEAKGWSAFDAALLRLADELHVNAFVGDATWNTLAAHYDQKQLVDAVFTVAEYTMLAAAMNAFGVQPDEGLAARLPAEIPRRTAAARVTDAQIRLPRARVQPLEPSEWTPAVRAMLDPSNSGRPVASVYRTFARHPQLYPPRQHLSEYIRLGSTLTARTREMLILRIGWLCRSEYEWSQHEPAGRRAGMSDAEIQGIISGPDASVWDRLDAAIVRAADELHRDDTITDATWTALGRHYNTHQLMDVVITTAGYRMVSMALNTFGVQLEADDRGFPSTKP